MTEHPDRLPAGRAAAVGGARLHGGARDGHARDGVTLATGRWYASPGPDGPGAPSLVAAVEGRSDESFMERTRLKNTELSVSRIGMGCSQIASASVPRREKGVVDAIHRALDLGVNFFDTADSYGQGDSELRVGRALKGRRDRAVISTKAGFHFTRSGGLLRRLKPFAMPLVRMLPGSGGAVQRMRASTIKQDFSPDYLRTCLEGSLQRLQTDYVDLFLLHNPDPSLLRDPHLIAALDGLVAAGKARYWGVSCGQAMDALPLVSDCRVPILQLPVSIAEQAACDRVLPEIEKARTGVVAREVFANGLLADPPAALKAIFESSGLSAWHAALRYALSRPGVDTALIGMSQVSHVESAGRLFEQPDLSDETCARIDRWRQTYLSPGGAGA